MKLLKRFICLLKGHNLVPNNTITHGKIYYSEQCKRCGKHDLISVVDYKKRYEWDQVMDAVAGCDEH